MSYERSLDDLIEAGWSVIETDFSPDAFLNWRKRALDCVTSLVGPDHPYAMFLTAFVVQGGRNSILAGVGVLEGTREQIAARDCGLITDDMTDLHLRREINVGQAKTVGVSVDRSARPRT
jgi:hypothetical protein